MAQVLIVDDDAILRAFAVELLTQAGHICEEAADGDLALRWLADHRVDLVVTDMFMPNKDGLEVLREIRTRWPSTKVIGISAGWNQIQAEDILRVAGAVGADAITDKPLTDKKFVALVDEVLQR